ncbi:ribonuclease Z [Rubellimicrobium rubrum]|uniref:Ribonuclease Z n=1 Tax=Rubellimicrobium rubrum TaxID=2585369 RepID=A0A5C4N6H5_9RHOB|nr:ribonuclease Z [Rubellimicrobium rubrum]TNC52303.1 ribonuclease Z [Rubellimicrobium rubrum]
MSWLVQSRLVNGPFGDPGVYVDFLFGRRAILFDLGDLSPLAPREVLRVSDVFVSHRHMDHFVGFDRLLRLRLNRPGVLRMVGPPGLIGGIRAKLDSYDWNLLGEGSVDFGIEAAEFAEGRLGPWTGFRARDAFRACPVARAELSEGVVLAEDDLTIECAALDHGVPCLAFALQERAQVSVLPEGLAQLGLSVGPWLKAAKSAVRRGEPDDWLIDAGDGDTRPLGLLREKAFRTAPGQRLAYVTDTAFHDANASHIRNLAQNAHQLYIEAVFLDEDVAEANLRRHLTAGQAGRLAREAGARRITTFHHSPRYLDRPEALATEACEAFEGTFPPLD